MYSKTLALTLLASLTTLAAASEPERFRSSAYGFSITPPAFPRQSEQGITNTPVTFQGPLRDGAASACNVQQQNLDVTPEQYRELSLGQFKALGLTVDAEEKRKVSGREAMFWRYSNVAIKAQALAVFDGNRTLLATCLAPESQYAEYEKMFEATLASLTLD